MLKITIPDIDCWDEKNEEFVYVKGQTLQLEHSLMSLKKWEQKWCKPFLSKTRMTPEETRDYIRCMTLTQNVDPRIYDYMPSEYIEQINKYIDAPMTAAWFSDDQTKKKNRGEAVTAEIIYYWMLAHGIPFECQKWHLNSLLALIRVCNIKSAPPKKMSRKEAYDRQVALNMARRKKLNSKG